MANTYTQLMYHVVFSTKDRRPVIHEERRDDICRYIWGIHEKTKCHLYRIGGVEDHIHILTSIPTTQSIAKYVEDVKTGSTIGSVAKASSPDGLVGRMDTTRSPCRGGIETAAVDGSWSGI